MELESLAQDDVLSGATVDVARFREAARRRRLVKVLICLAPIAIWMYWRIVAGRPVVLGLPHMSEFGWQMLMMFGFVVILGIAVLAPLAVAGRSPHVRYDPSEIDVTFNDVVGLG